MKLYRSNAFICCESLMPILAIVLVLMMFSTPLKMLLVLVMLLIEGQEELLKRKLNSRCALSNCNEPAGTVAVFVSCEFSRMNR